MLPSLVVEEVRRGVAETLRTQFEPSTELFKDAVRRLIDQPNWVKGPYVQINMPFVAGKSGRTFFSDFETEYPAHRHQELAWQRCGTHKRSTLVATGTGSGKTECFLYPVLDHVAKARAAGEKGIKAIIVYPMNALADDQAGRIAELVHSTPAFAGIRTGLFVGSGKPSYKPGASPVMDTAEMSADQVITDKDVQRNDPPDILLTNYKMLDFLMIRPQDQPLWRFNAPETLKYLVVDELHTFDGAQGTDLAMLIRRLRRRLDCEGDKLVCVGTSATLGDSGNTLPLREYASEVFATDFDENSVITESRQGFDEFIGKDCVVEHLLADDDTVLQIIAKQEFPDQAAAVIHYLPAFFSRPEVLQVLVDEVSTARGRVQLGEELKKHLLFQTVLRSAIRADVTIGDIAGKVRRTLSSRVAPYAAEVVIGLLSLIAWARMPYPGQEVKADTQSEQLGSLVNLRIQVWIQELRRVVATVDPQAEEIVLTSEANVLGHRERLRLPLVQCSHCRTTGWLTIKRPQDSRVERSADQIYTAFFARNPDATLARVYPRPSEGADSTHPAVPVLELQLCGRCGTLNGNVAKQCSSCQNDSLVPVQIANATRTKQSTRTINGVETTQNDTLHDDTCIVCGQRENQMILGAQTTTVAAHAVERLWSAPLNNHKKLILFSDSVQDAAHRAGYLEAKTENHLIRAALARAIDQLADGVVWADALKRLGTIYLDPTGPLNLSPEDFVARFIPPRLQWKRDWKTLVETGRLPAESALPRDLCQLIQWRAVEELTHLADRGPTLSKTGLAALYPDLAALRELSDELGHGLREARGGLDEVADEAVFHWVVGSVLMMIQAGAVFHLGLEYVAETGDYPRFSYARKWLPQRGKAPTPRFVASIPGRHGFMNLEERDANPLIGWARLALRLDFASPGILSHAYTLLLGALNSAGLGRYVTLDQRGHTDQVFGFNPERLHLHHKLCRLCTVSNAQSIWVPEEAVELLNGMPSWSSPGEVLRPVLGDEQNWWHERLKGGDVERVIAHEHTGLLERDERIDLQNRFMAKAADAKPWFENLLSATPTLEMGINIGALSSVMLGGVPPNQANYLQRIGRAGRLDGNAAVFTIADASPDGHDQYYFSNPQEMLGGDVDPPAIYLGAAEVLRRQLYAFFFDHWVAEESPTLPDKLSEAMDEVAKGTADVNRFPYNYLDFVNRNEPQIFEAFCRMLGDKLRSETRQKLEYFITGSAQHKHLRARFLAYFEECNAERETWKQRRKDIGNQLRRLKGQPKDEQTEAEIDILEKERAGLNQRILQLNGEHLLEAMTNAGLLPNYAFPEEGVSLTTIIHGKRPKTGEEYSVPIHQYSRPAHAALAEFAPRNTFFAHKSKVEVDQIDMSVEDGATFRFCASCHFLVKDSDPRSREGACPACGDTRFSDGSQSRSMLRLRRAVANVDHSDRTRITESDEGRTQRFYARKLLMNFERENVRSAWTFESTNAIYGFEFLSRADFHDVNVGQPVLGGPVSQQTLMAGDETVKAGFSLCGGCGKVQPFYRPSATDNEPRKQVHTPDCKHRHETGTGHLKDELFLFREFESECLRIMVPQGFGSGDRTTFSFMAVLQLGLRKRFGGKVDHLRFETMNEASGSDHAGKTYILIYDSVPGGTGYLQQLLAGQADTLTEVLSAAHAVVRDCGCQTLPDTDGCYQCVFQHRQGRQRKHISRLAALEILDELVTGEFKRKAVDCLSEIYISSAFGSELERRFLPAMKAIGGQLDVEGNRLQPVQISQDIKDGKTAYLMVVGSNKYWVDQQVPIDDVGTGLTLCQPDFVISATKTASPMKPIAIFVDGWEFHQKCLADDARKRATLMLRGDYHVWSITHEDIEAALKQHAGTDLESPLVLITSPAGKSIPNDRLPAIGGMDLRGNAIAQLVYLLGAGSSGSSDPLDNLSSTGKHLLIRSVVKPQDVTTEQADRLSKVFSSLPDWLVEGIEPVPLQSPEGRGLQWVGRATPKFVSGASAQDAHVAGAVVLDDRNWEFDPKSLRLPWRHWLRLANLLQAVDGVALLTETMLDKKQGLNVYKPSEAAESVVSSDWNQVLDDKEFIERLHQGMVTLANAGVPAPDSIGAEFEDESGYRIAEVLWEAVKIVVLTSNQIECSESWRIMGYRVVEEKEQWWIKVQTAFAEENE